MSDITGITNLNFSSAGDTSLTGIKAAVGNLNTDKAESSTLTAHTGASVGIHGITGSAVGSTDTQTLTNKNLTSPTVSGTMTGTYGLEGANISGALNTLTVRELDFLLADNVTANVSTSKHGLIPKLTNESGKFFSATGTYIPASATFKGIVGTYAGDTASGSQVIAHGLGTTPTFVEITAWKNINANNNATQPISQSHGTYNGTTTNCIYFGIVSTQSADGIDTTNIIHINDTTTGDVQVATITVNATNITLAWTKTGSPSSKNINMLIRVS